MTEEEKEFMVDIKNVVLMNIDLIEVLIIAATSGEINTSLLYGPLEIVKQGLMTGVVNKVDVKLNI